ncbi:hypothetical protein HPC49_33700, partial [Pyxidicoccus fallax]
FPDWLAQGTRPPDIDVHVWNGMGEQFQKQYIQAEREKAVAKDWPPPEFDVTGPPPPFIDAMTWGHLSSEGRKALFQQQWQAAVREQTNLLFAPGGVPPGGTVVEHPFLGVDSDLGRGKTGLWLDLALNPNPAADGAQYLNLSKVLGPGWPVENYNLCGPLAVGGSLGLDPRQALTAFSNDTVVNGAYALSEGLTTVGTQLVDMYEVEGWTAEASSLDNKPPHEMARLISEGKQLIALVNIDTKGADGMLKSFGDSTKKVAHWVNVLAVEQTGSGDWMVRVYNPYENREEVYPWTDFHASWSKTGVEVQVEKTEEEKTEAEKAMNAPVYKTVYDFNHAYGIVVATPPDK